VNINSDLSEVNKILSKYKNIGSPQNCEEYELCYYNVAKNKKNISICEKIGTESTKQDCIKYSRAS